MFSPEQAQGLAMFLVQGIETEYETTKKVIAALPEDKLEYTLGDKGRSAKDLTWHIVESEIWFLEGVANKAFPMSESKMGAPGTVKEMLDYYQREFAVSLAKVKALSGEHLATPVSFFGVFNMPAVMYLGFQNNHTIHHRGQLSTYLRAMNAHVPSIYGGSADEPFQMPA